MLPDHIVLRQMDRTEDFVAAAGKLEQQQQSDTVSGLATLPLSSFVLRAAQLLTQISSFENLVVSIADSFIDYHRFHPTKLHLHGSKDMTEAERVEFTQEIAIFVTTFAGEVRKLRQLPSNFSIVIDKGKENPSSRKEENNHREEVISYLLERLSLFTKMTQRLQNERLKYSVNALCLFTNTTNTSIITNFKKSLKTKKSIKSKDEKGDTNFSDLLNKLDDNEVDRTKKKDFFLSITKKVPVPIQLSQSFVERYESEIAPMKVLKEYEKLGEKHKKILLKESKVLQVQYSEELLETTKMEKSVIKISNLLFDFVNILQSQRELIDDVNKCGKTTLAYVNDTDNELLLTIQRSQSHLQSMVVLYIGLSIVLLILDFVTP